MKFASPEYLYLLLLIPAFIALRLVTYYKRRKALHKLGDKELVYRMMPQLSLLRENIKFSIILLIFSLLVLLLARPQMGTKVSKEERNGIEVMIAMDISNSMRAEDVVPSRLDKTKLLIENLVDHFNKDKVGMVVFAGDAYVQLPITGDYISAKMFMQSISPELIAAQGTNIADAIDLSMESFTKQEGIGKAIILITDGEDHEGGAEEAAALAFKRGFNVFVLGVGSTKGAPVPTGEGGYMRDNEGNEVMSSLNEDMCRKIAEAGHGTYIHVENNNRAQELLNDHLSHLQKGQMESVVYSDYEEQFQPVVMLILFLLLIELLISDNSNGFFTKLSKMASRKTLAENSDKMKIGNKVIAKAILLLVLFGASSFSANAQNDRQFIRSGNKYYRAQKFDKADIEYKKALERNPNNPEALYNMGCAKMMQDNDSLALDYFDKAAQVQKDKKRKAQVYHNAGVILQNHKDYEKAIEAYKASLRNDPTNDETRYNLALCQKLLKNQQKNQKNQNKDKNQNNQNQDQNKNQNNKDQNKQNDKNDKNQNKNNDQNKDNKDQQNPEESKQEKINKENAEQLLNAAKNQERAVQEKVKRAQQRRRNTSKQKNW
ncbi:MAG: VWA domain-containing protein [Bacteroidaceae bacterium]|nr:VWA domain-containing protein [Bacteroidaceae bacterium]